GGASRPGRRATSASSLTCCAASSTVAGARSRSRKAGSRSPGAGSYRVEDRVQPVFAQHGAVAIPLGEGEDALGLEPRKLAADRRRTEDAGIDMEKFHCLFPSRVG
ncbi:hypothetical protein QU38_01430, partial [Staphylococcus aureus]